MNNMNWKQKYEETLKNICEANANDFDAIVETEQPDYSVNLVENENADIDALYSFKLDDNATEEDYKKFVEYIYSYIDADLNDFNKENGDNNMEQETKIRKLLKMYGAEDKEIENFMTDLKEMKDDIEEDNLLITNAEKLKMTEEGREIIKNAPNLAKDELGKKIKEVLHL